MFFHFLFSLIIKPIELVLEFIFSFAYKMTGNLGISVIFVGILMNILILPIYIKADKISKMQTEKEKSMKPYKDRINKAFKGDERFMMLQAYYRENSYSPLSILLSSLSLLLEIPFFIAGFHLLSGLKIVSGVPFLFISDLSLPDRIFNIGSLPVNILPIVMTMINLVSSLIYSKNQTARGKIQTYGLALIFLVLLYDSPSCLVLYWTTNNLFSLVKNIFMETPAGKAFKGRKISLPRIAVFEGKADLSDHAIAFMSLAFLALLTGFQVSSDVINSAVESFIYPQELLNPNYYVFNSLFIALGMYLLWGGIIYYMLSDKGKKVMGFILSSLSLICLTDYFGFGEGGTLDPVLKFEFGLKTADTMKMGLNILVLILVFLLVFIFYKNNKKILSGTVLVEILSVIVLGSLNVINIDTEFNKDLYLADQNDPAVFNLSREGQNVIVLMLDKTAGFLLPYIMNEDPSLYESFDGFTYYPNTLSFGNYTITGSPSLFGGYGYTPDRINERSDTLLMDKQNDALRVMPVNFLDSGFNVTVSDPSYANYKWVPDLSIYDDHPEINTYITNGNYNTYANGNVTAKVWERNIFCYGFFRLSPLFMRSLLYDNAMYNAADREYFNDFYQIASDTHTSRGYKQEFLDSYTVLTSLNDITQVSENGDNFIMFVNYTVHDCCLLSEPSYEPALYVDNTAFDEANSSRFSLNGNRLSDSTPLQNAYYQSYMCAMRQLGNWFDYLRENGCYDNTRIIIVSDHGYNVYEVDPLLYDGIDAGHFNPLLLVKDFGSTGFTVSDEFMTNADTPFIAMEGIVSSPVDPSSGEPLTDDARFDRPLHVFNLPTYLLYDNYGNTTFGEGAWYYVSGDVFDENSWEFDDIY
ncbi:MAG: YidC/Oxa1 family membrane protein insertase [Clostridiales bacterium]|nr:YidC/Oxa1 family membrane protein insertase [Clostridiales bacterium]